MSVFKCKKITLALALSFLLVSGATFPVAAQTLNDYYEATKEDCTNEAGGCQQIVD
ncbi:hypothetical protein [Candidatus Cyanaurora vandensis]|uniref:hypothetical protein n=1 Tax=Candidatus Cyanaurora vandensis TaxID=2714958 RepID=UPI00257B48B5|nr:hypothetical protein [Candidatus Cyanaurora vandensis]